MKKALITGASSGIGATFARELANRGHDLVLVARRKDKLEKFAMALAEAHSVTADPFVADLSEEAGIEQVERRVAELEDLYMLINNAGFGTRGLFAEADLSKQLAMVTVHVIASLRLARAALPGMIQRRQGRIINLSSLGSFAAMPESAVYSGTKAFLNLFSEGIQSEVRHAGIRVQALCPGFTVTEFHEVGDFKDFDRSRLPKYLWMSAEEVVKESLEAIERGSGVICIPGRKNRLIAATIRNRFWRRIIWRARAKSRDEQLKKKYQEEL